MAWVKWLERLEILLDYKSSGKWFLLSAAIGLVAGFGAIAFQLASQTVMHFTLGQMAGYAPREPAGEHPLFERPEGPFWRGNSWRSSRPADWFPDFCLHVRPGSGRPRHRRRDRIVPLQAGLHSLADSDHQDDRLGSHRGDRRIRRARGADREIGAGFGSFLATQMKLSVRDRRIMLAAGMGAGVRAIFRAPLAGALFAAEILYRTPI